MGNLPTGQASNAKRNIPGHRITKKMILPDGDKHEYKCMLCDNYRF